MSFVVDSSIALTWCFEDEATPVSDPCLGAPGDPIAGKIS